MSEILQKCFCCGINNHGPYINVMEIDSDYISYWEKLIMCISPDLVQQDTSVMCSDCINLLRISHDFKTTTLRVQGILKKEGSSSDGSLSCKDEIKSEDESDENGQTDSSYSDDEGEKSVVKKRKYTRAKVRDISLICEHCGLMFDKQWKLRKHLKRVHISFRKYVCTYCDKDFKQSFHLKEHLTSHTGEKNFTCPICDTKFQRLSSQRRHLRGHDRPPGQKTKRTPFLCTICGKSFPYSNGVQRHMRIHLGIKKFECAWCNRKFTQSTHLQVHTRTHTGEKPYMCGTCGDKFSLKACLLKHIENKHFDSKSRDSEDDRLFYLAKVQ